MIRLTLLEHDVLKYIAKLKEYKYIARDEDGEIYVYEKKPRKSYCQWCIIGHPYFFEQVSLPGYRKPYEFVQWEDEEPMLIEDILSNCEVVDNA